MKILFTGANGFLGKNLISDLNKNHTVFTLGLNDSDFQCDLSKEIPNLDQLNIDVVFHAAGKAHSIPKTDLEIKKFYEVNVDGTKNLCESLEKNNLPKVFIFISTVAVYGREEGTQITEEHPISGKTPYAESKLIAERFLQNWCKRNNVKLIILRPSLIAGKNPSGNLGDMISAINKGRYLNINHGKARKSVFFVKDFIFIIENAFKMNAGIYNVCDSQHPSFKELSVLIAKQLGKSNAFSIPLLPAKIIAKCGDFLGNKAPINTLKLSKIINSLTFSNEKIKKELGWEPSDVINNFKI